MTSNLIAFWKSENERWANEQEALHNKVLEKQNEKRMQLEDAWNRMNLQISQFRANEEARHNAAQERLTALGQQLQQAEINLALRRQEETERYNREQIAQAERNRVTDSYLTQKKIQSEERIKSKELDLNRYRTDTSNDLTKRSQNIQLGLGIADNLTTRRGQTLNYRSNEHRNWINLGSKFGDLALNVFSTALRYGGQE